MKYIKTHESFLIGGVLAAAGILGLIKLTIKYIENKTDRDLVFDILENLPSSGNKKYTIIENSDKMTLFLDGDKLLDLDLTKREIIYDLKLKYEHNIKVSLNRKDFNHIKSALSFISGVNKEVYSCFQELIDYDYNVVIRDYEFFKKSFSISVKQKYDEPIELETVYSCIERLELMYNVSLKVSKSDATIIPNKNIDNDFKYKVCFNPPMPNGLKATREFDTSDLNDSRYKTLNMNFISNS